MRLRCRSLFTVIAIVAASACDRPQAILLCHNVNCASTINPALDDTEVALRRSLDLRYNGRPVIDGLEIDVFWNRTAGGVCQVAHEVGTIDRPMTPVLAARIIAEHMAAADPVSWNGDTFYVMFELKGFVDESFSKHTPEEAAMHAECALNAFGVLERAVAGSNTKIEITFDSTSPKLLAALTDSAAWPGRRSGMQVDVRLSGDFSDPTSLGVIQNPKLRDLMNAVDLDNVVLHSAWINYGSLNTLRSLNLDITIWMFSATADTFAVLNRVEPEYVVTSEALLLRRWLEY